MAALFTSERLFVLMSLVVSVGAAVETLVIRPLVSMVSTGTAVAEPTEDDPE